MWRQTPSAVRSSEARLALPRPQEKAAAQVYRWPRLHRKLRAMNPVISGRHPTQRLLTVQSQFVGACASCDRCNSYCLRRGGCRIVAVLSPCAHISMPPCKIRDHRKLRPHYAIGNAETAAPSATVPTTSATTPSASRASGPSAGSRMPSLYAAEPIRPRRSITCSKCCPIPRARCTWGTCVITRSATRWPATCG